MESPEVTKFERDRAKRNNRQSNAIAPGAQAAGESVDDEPSTWEPVDLAPFLRGEVRRPKPCVGMARSDGLRLLYPGREHAVLGETESGKTWFALGCVAAVLVCDEQSVLYIHYEEPDAESTIERLRLLGVSDEAMSARFRFVTPMRPIRTEWLVELLNPAPSLVVHDGVNEAMSLHKDEIGAAEGASAFRRKLVLPFTRMGAATLACDHLPMLRDSSRRDAYGSVHKGNALDGARIELQNTEPFGRGLRGASYVFITKDRPGHLRAHGQPTKTPGKTFAGTLVVDDSQSFNPFELAFYAPRDDESEPTSVTDADAELQDAVWEAVAAMPDRTVASRRELLAQMRSAGQQVRDDKVRDVLDDLVALRRLIEVSGKRGAIGYRAVASVPPTASQSF